MKCVFIFTYKETGKTLAKISSIPFIPASDMFLQIKYIIFKVANLLWDHDAEMLRIQLCEWDDVTKKQLKEAGFE
jgi:hypothetical protein